MNPPPLGELEGQVAVVTGSARGIGRAIALELASAGAHVLIHARHNREDAEVVAATVRTAGRQATVAMCDLAEPNAQDALLETAWRWHGVVTIWVNNAGIDILTGELARETFEQKLAALWQVDVVAAMRLSRMAGQRMKAAGGGAIVNVGWDGVDYGMAGDSAQLYAATKGAVIAFSRSLAQSLCPEVRVNCVSPGWICTDWGKQASSYWDERARAESLIGRWGTPEDIARVVRFAVSPAAAFLNGQNLQVNGGRKSSPISAVPSPSSKVR